MPKSISPDGLYHGFDFSFAGETNPEWHWSRPANVIYPSLKISWNKEDEVYLALPTFQYTSQQSTGTLTRDLLRIWLIGSSNRTDLNRHYQKVDEVYGTLKSAANGTLPPPRHHTYYRNNQLESGDSEADFFALQLQHFCTGGNICDKQIKCFLICLGGNVALFLAALKLGFFKRQVPNAPYNTPTFV